MKLQEEFARFTVNTPKRNSWNKLFFNYKLKAPFTSKYVKQYSDSLEMVRLALSSGNNQSGECFLMKLQMNFTSLKIIENASLIVKY